MPSRNGSNIEVLVLVQAECVFCAKALVLLDRLAREYDLHVTTRDLNTVEGQDAALRDAILFPPGIFLNGQPFSYGPISERKLRRELDRRLAAGA